MIARKTLRHVLYAIFGIALTVGLSIPVLALPLEAQAAIDWHGEYYANADLIGAPTLVRSDREPGGAVALDFN